MAIEKIEETVNAAAKSEGQGQAALEGCQRESNLRLEEQTCPENAHAPV